MQSCTPAHSIKKASIANLTNLHAAEGDGTELRTCDARKAEYADCISLVTYSEVTPLLIKVLDMRLTDMPVTMAGAWQGRK